MSNSHQPRSQIMGFMRHKPYNARTSTHRNIEAESSGQAPPPSSYGSWRLTQPPRSSPETVNTKQTKTTEEEAPVSDFYRSPAHHVTDSLFGVRCPGPGAAVTKGWNVPTASGIRMTYSGSGYGLEISEGAENSLTTRTQ